MWGKCGKVFTDSWIKSFEALKAQDAWTPLAVGRGVGRGMGRAMGRAMGRLGVIWCGYDRPPTPSFMLLLVAHPTLFLPLHALACCSFTHDLIRFDSPAVCRSSNRLLSRQGGSYQSREMILHTAHLCVYG